MRSVHRISELQDKGLQFYGEKVVALAYNHETKEIELEMEGGHKAMAPTVSESELLKLLTSPTVSG